MQSLDGQMELDERLCATNDWRIVASIKEVHSREYMYLLDLVAHSKGFARIVQLIQDEEIDILVAWRRDRLWRNEYAGADLRRLCEEHHVRIQTVMEPTPLDSPVVEDMVNSFTAMASKAEQRARKERWERGMTERVIKRGLSCRTSHVQYGYRRPPSGSGRDAPDIIDPERARWVIYIFERLANRAGWETIVGELERAHAPTARGGKWSPTTVKHIARNPHYVGEVWWRRYRKHPHGDRRNLGRPTRIIKSAGAHEPIISRELWERARAVDPLDELGMPVLRAGIGGPVRGYERMGKPPRLFTGLCKCGLCGHAMVYVKRDSEYSLAMHCHHHQRDRAYCQSNYHQESTIRRYVVAWLREYLARPDDWLAAERLRQRRERDGQASEHELEAEIADIDARLRRLIEGYASGRILLDIYAQQQDELVARKKARQAELAELRQLEARLQATAGRAHDMRQVLAKLDHLSTAQLRELLLILVERINLRPGQDPEIVLRPQLPVTFNGSSR